MDWTEYVQQNYTAMNLRFMVVKHKNPRHEWKGRFTNYITPWTRGPHSRLYIPITLVSNAGYIDLNRKTIGYIQPEIEGAEEKLQEVFDYLKEHAR